MSTLSSNSLFCAVAASLIMAAGSSGAVIYSLRDLGDIPGGNNSSYAAGLNNLGQVTGSSFVAGGNGNVMHAFRWTPAGGMEDLGTMLPNNPSLSSNGYAINDSGVVVGVSPSSGIANSAFISQPGSAMTTVPGMPGSTILSTGQAINNSGQITGIDNTGTRHAYRYTPGNPIVFRNPPADVVSGETIGYAINESGAMAGFSPINGGARAVYWASDGTATNLGRLAGGTLDYSFAFGMNDGGAVVGQSGARIGTADHLRAFLWTSAGGMIDLGDLGDPTRDGAAQDINNNGWVVGQFNAPLTPVNQLAFLWIPGTGMASLNSLLDTSGTGWIVNTAGGINDNGQIAATAYNIAGGYSHAVLLTPVPAPAAVGLGAVAVAFGARRRRR